MDNIPILKPKEVISLLKRLGFEEIRHRGSHRQNPDNRNILKILVRTITQGYLAEQ